MERWKKCTATGKVTFNRLIEARFAILSIRWNFRNRRDELGRRIKHRQGTPAQRRAYFCEHCAGYHITKWKKSNFKSYKENRKKREEKLDKM